MDMLEIIKSIILGIIQGISEWLPISSTGHLILADEFLKLNIFENVELNTEFVSMFMVVIQLGSILAVLFLYFDKLNPFDSKFKLKKDTVNLWFKVAVAAIPAGIMGLLFDDLIDQYFYNYVVVAIMLVLYGVIFIIVENRKNIVVIDDINDLTYKKAFMVGVYQILALIPGTSRSGSTIIGSLLLGLSRPVAAEFSFFLAIPMMFAASLLKLIKLNITLTGFSLIVLLVGTVVSFIVSVFVIKYFMNYIRKHDFKVFGYYRIVLGIIILIYFLV